MSPHQVSVVLVEDDEDDYLLTRDLLDEIEQEDFDLQWVSTYDEALEVIKAVGADVYLVDYRLGQYSGLDLLKEALSQGNRAPIIMLTGQGNREIDVKAMQSGAADYLIKGEINSYLLERAIRYAMERKEIAEALRASEEHFRALIENSSDGIVLMDRDGHLNYASPACEKILGYASERARGRNVLERIRADYRSKFRRDLSLVLEKPGTTIETEARLRHKDGSWRWLEGTLSNLLDQESVASVVINFRDVTERRQRERELEAVALVSKALRSAPSRQDMLPIILDEVMGLLDGGAAALALFDANHEEMRIDLARGAWSDRTGSPVSAEHGISARVVRTGETYLNNDARSDAEFDPQNLREGLNCIVCMPFIARDSTLGVLWLIRENDIGDSEVRILRSIADMSATALQRETLFEQTERRLSNLRALRTIDLAISSSFDRMLTLSILIDQVFTQLGVDATAVLLADRATSRLEFASGRGFRGRRMEELSPGIPDGKFGLIVRDRTTQYQQILDFADAGSRADIFRDEGIVFWAGTPLISKGLVIGVLEVFSRSPIKPDDEWSSFLDALAGQAAIAVENIVLFEDLQRKNVELIAAYDATIEGWSHALDLRDKETEGHSRRVTEMTIELAKAFGVSDDELLQIRRGALLHDMGKLGIPDAVLLKPGQLSDGEWKIMRMHPTYAYEMLSPIAYLRSALDIPYCHHEKWDGSGYPRGLKGQQIPLAARLFAVVDVWDALSSDRPYRPAWPREKVRAYIEELSGTHFDPEIVGVFLRLRGKNDKT